MTSLRTRMSRQRILDGAWQILDAGTVNDLTVDAIARALHMSKSTLYKYFTSKEDAVIELVDQACQATRDEVHAAMESLKRSDLESAVDQVLGLYASHADRLPAGVILDPHRLPPACRRSLEATWTVLHEGCQAAVRNIGSVPDELGAVALSTSARAAITAAAEGKVDMSRGDAVRSLRSVFLQGLTSLVKA